MAKPGQEVGQLRWWNVWGICLLTLCLSGPLAGAVDLHPDTKQWLVESGNWEDVKQTILTARAAGMNTPREKPATLAASAVTDFGNHIPCILVEFSDNLWADGTVNTSPGFIDTMLFSEGEYPTGSFREYYLENSYGVFDPTGEVVGPLMMPQTYLYYVGSRMGISTSDSNSQSLAHDAILAADPYIDFSQFDVDGNNEVDGVMIIFAGHGFEEANDESSQTIQSHQWTLPEGKVLFLDGVTIKEYTVQPEEHGPVVGGGTNGIGVVCHEWGHILDLPDLYDEDFSSWGLGRWSIMGSGNYLNNSHTPSHFDPWCKVQLGWVSVDNVQANRIDQAIPDFATSPTVFRLWLAGITGWEYFLVCNRRQTGFDAELPGSGLLILHCDDSRSNNRNEYIPDLGNPIYHYMVAVVQADGDYELERYEAGNPGDAGDLYTDRSIEFDELTAPSSRAYTGLSTQVAVWNISPSGPVMTANLDVTYSRPLLQYLSHTFNDDSGDGDDVPDPGETVQMSITTQNLWKPTTDIVVTVSCSQPDVVFTNSSFTIPELGTGGLYLNHGADAIVFSVAAGLQPTIADFFISYASEGGAFTFAETLSVDLGPKQVLILDDDGKYLNKDYAHYYADALETLRVPYAVHDKVVQGSPTGGLLGGYPMVLWFSGHDRGGALLVHDDVAALQTYLDGGGRLFLTGQDIAEKLSPTADSLFLVDYLGARYADTSTIEPPFVRGVDGDPIGDGISMVLGGSGTAANQHNPDNLIPVPGASTSFIYDPVYSSGAVAGVTYAHDGFKIVFWGFGFEAVNSTLPQYGVSRLEILSDILFWLVGLSTGILEEDEFVENDVATLSVPERYTLFQNYPNPFNGRTTIEYFVAAGQVGEITIEILDILGRKVTTVFSGTAIPGRHQVAWDGRDQHGRDVSSGVYFYRIFDHEGNGQSRRMVYLK